MTDDDPGQVAAARSLVAANPVWIAKTVLLEAIWVLQTQYHLRDDAIHEAFIRFLGRESVQFEDEGQIVAALALDASGVDFADAFHLASRPAGVPFVSVDKAFLRPMEQATRYLPHLQPYEDLRRS